VANVVNLSDWVASKKPQVAKGWTLSEQCLLHKHVEHVNQRGIPCELELIRAEGGEPVAIFGFERNCTVSFARYGDEIIVLDTDGKLLMRAPSVDQILVHMWWGDNRAAFDAWNTDRRVG
jgi:hypothetical protein